MGGDQEVDDELGEMGRLMNFPWRKNALGLLLSELLARPTCRRERSVQNCGSQSKQGRSELVVLEATSNSILLRPDSSVRSISARRSTRFALRRIQGLKTRLCRRGLVSCFRDGGLMSLALPL